MTGSTDGLTSPGPARGPANGPAGTARGILRLDAEGRVTSCTTDLPSRAPAGQGSLIGAFWWKLFSSVEPRGYDGDTGVEQFLLRSGDGHPDLVARKYPAQGGDGRPDEAFILIQELPVASQGGPSVIFQGMAGTKETTPELMQFAKLLSLGELVAVVAHEINNPLSIVSCQLQLQLQERHEDDPDRDQVASMEEEVQRVIDLAKQLSAFTRRSDGEHRELNLNAVVEDVLKLLAYPMETDNVQVERHLAEDLPFVYGDENGLKQVCLNLITNAWQAMPQGGKLEIRSRQVAGPTEPAEAPRVEVAFTDTGPGIPEASAEKIFEPFYSTKGKKGTGLGLAVARKIVETHGGTLSLADGVSQGASLVMNLPAMTT